MDDYASFQVLNMPIIIREYKDKINSNCDIWLFTRL